MLEIQLHSIIVAGWHGPVAFVSTGIVMGFLSNVHGNVLMSAGETSGFPTRS